MNQHGSRQGQPSFFSPGIYHPSRHAPGLDPDKIGTHGAVIVSWMITLIQARCSEKAFTLPWMDRMKGALQDRAHLHLYEHQKLAPPHDKIDLTDRGFLTLGQQPKISEAIVPGSDMLG